jgi:threonine synthase
VAGLLGKHQRGELDPGQQIVVTLTGNGLKDIDTALSQRAPVQAEIVAPDVQQVALASGLRG